MSFGAFLDGVMSGMERGANLGEYVDRSKYNRRVRKANTEAIDRMDKARVDAVAGDAAEMGPPKSLAQPAFAAAGPVGPPAPVQPGTEEAPPVVMAPDADPAAPIATQGDPASQPTAMSSTVQPRGFEEFIGRSRNRRPVILSQNGARPMYPRASPILGINAAYDGIA